MRMKRGLLVLSGLLVVFAISCAATPNRRSFKEGWKDSVVSTEVKYKLIRDRLVKKSNINVDVWRGVVTLTGRVGSEAEKERAEELAWKTKGVRGVDNFLRIIDVTGNLVEEGVATAKKEKAPLVGSGEKTQKVATSTAPVITAKKRPASKVTTPALSKRTDTSASGALKTEGAPATVSQVQKTGVPDAASTQNQGKPVFTDIPIRGGVSAPFEAPSASSASPGKVAPRVEGPVQFEKRTTGDTAKPVYSTRGDYSKTPSGIEEKDLSAEEKLSRDAEEELKKLKGE